VGEGWRRCKRVMCVRGERKFELPPPPHASRVTPRTGPNLIVLPHLLFPPPPPALAGTARRRPCGAASGEMSSTRRWHFKAGRRGWRWCTSEKIRARSMSTRDRHDGPWAARLWGLSRQWHTGVSRRPTQGGDAAAALLRSSSDGDNMRGQKKRQRFFGAKALCFGTSGGDACGYHYPHMGRQCSYLLRDRAPGENPWTSSWQRWRGASLPSWGRCRGIMAHPGLRSLSSLTSVGLLHSSCLP
jgi:hypothetical protein